LPPFSRDLELIQPAFSRIRDLLELGSGHHLHCLGQDSE